MEYVILGILILIVILLLILLTKNSDNVTEKLGKVETDIVKELGEFKYGVIKDNRDNFELLCNKVEKKLTNIDDALNARLDVNFERTNKTFSNVLERLSKIDEAQKKIDSLSSDIVSLQSVLTDKKTRGTFGEVNLNYILSNVFGENNKKIYETQKLLPNGAIVDAILYAPTPLGTICIDSKFPLENYQRMIDKSYSKEERTIFYKKFDLDVKKHIDDIANKYIISGTTSDEAIMFLPAEAIFAEINAYHSNLITYAYSRKVWITSPTTLMSTLTVISMILKDMERDKYTAVIHQELNKLSLEFMRYKDRWDKLARSIDSVGKEVQDIHITTEKITKRFELINNVNIESNLIENKTSSDDN